MRLYFVLFATALALSTSGCSDDAPALFTETAWRVRCPSGGTGCSEQSPDRTIFNVDGEAGHSLQCTATLDGQIYILTFKIGNPGEEYSLAIDGARFPRTGGNLMGLAEITVQEGANTYQGKVGAGPISDMQECMAETIAVGQDENGDPQVSSRVICRGLPNVVDPNLSRDVTAAGASQQAQMDPFSFRLVNCPGL